MYDVLTTFLNSDIFNIAVGVIGAIAVLYSAVNNLTTISALTQMSSVTSRAASWSDLTKKPIHKIEKMQQEISSYITTSRDKDNVKPEEALGAVRTQDKITYTFGTCNLMLTGFIAGATPHYYWLWHSPKLAAYIFHRWWTFKKEGKHYLLFDLCYFVNFLFLAYLVFFPENEVLFYMSFILSNGPVGWAVLAFNQSLILHSIPHMTSVFIHASPVVLSFCLRWFPSDRHKVCEDFPACKQTEFWKNLVFQPQYFYLTWVVLYYIFIYFVMDHRIRTRGYQTLFNRIITSGPTKKIAKLSDNEMVQKTIYMFTHILFATGTMLLATVYFRNQIAHFIFMFCILAASAWTASGYYFNCFVNQYSDNLRKRAGLPEHFDPKGVEDPRHHTHPNRQPGHHGKVHHHHGDEHASEEKKEK